MIVILWSVISIFIVLGIQYFIKELIKMKLNNPPSVIIYGCKDENETEYILRCALFENPDSEIYLFRHTHGLSTVLEKMIGDHPNIHIKYYD